MREIFGSESRIVRIAVWLKGVHIDVCDDADDSDADAPSEARSITFILADVLKCVHSRIYRGSILMASKAIMEAAEQRPALSDVESAIVKALDPVLEADAKHERALNEA